MAEPAPAENRRRNSGKKMPEGRRFEKGKSGNPGGRPLGLARATREVLQGAVHEGEDSALAIVRFWASVLGDKTQPMHYRLRASELLAERGWGKAAEYAPIESDDPLEQDLPPLGPRTRERLAGLLELAVAEPDVGAQVVELASRRK